MSAGFLFPGIALHCMGRSRLAAITFRSIATADNASCMSSNSSAAISIPSRHHHDDQKQHDSRDTANDTADSR